MEMQDKLDALRRIVNTKAGELTAEDKTFVTELAAENDVEIRRKGCGSCIIEAAVQIFGLLTKEQEQSEQPADEDGRQYVLKDGVNVIFNGNLVNEATINDKLAAALIAKGFSKSFFAKFPTDEDKE